MSRSLARVATPHASRYLQQLSKHWAHKLEVRFDAENAHIDFGGAICELAAGADTLDILLTASAEDLERYKGVVERHLQRFAFREGELVFEWRDEAE